MSWDDRLLTRSGSNKSKGYRRPDPPELLGDVPSFPSTADAASKRVAEGVAEGVADASGDGNLRRLARGCRTRVWRVTGTVASVDWLRWSAAAVISFKTQDLLCRYSVFGIPRSGNGASRVLVCSFNIRIDLVSC